jgi:hypothetical protein
MSNKKQKPKVPKQPKPPTQQPSPVMVVKGSKIERKSK